MRPFGKLLISFAVARTAIGFLILIFFTPNNTGAVYLCLCLFALAQLSDQIDGWIARKFSWPTVGGYLQDSVSDKLLHIGCLLAFSEYFTWVGIFVWFICAREMIILAFRVVLLDLSAKLKKYKYQSIIYASALRTSIVLFLLFPLVPQLENLILFASYLLLVSASLLAVWNLAVLTAEISRGGGQRRPRGADGPH